MNSVDRIVLKILARDLLDRHLAELIAVDQAVRQELGDRYSDEAWDVEQFSRDVPGKWTYSICSLEQNQVVGFWIASERIPGMVYAHRVAVKHDKRHLGIGKLMFEAVRDTACRNRCSTMGLSVSVLNSQAIRFYEQLGFVRVVGQDIPIMLGGRSSRTSIASDYYQTSSGQRNYLYVLQLNGRE